MGIVIFPLILVGVMGGVVILHIAPWGCISSLVDERKDLHRPIAYLIGNSCILAGMALTERAGIVPLGTTLRLFLLMTAAGVGAIVPRTFAYAAEKKALEADKRDAEG